MTRVIPQLAVLCVCLSALLACHAATASTPRATAARIIARARRLHLSTRPEWHRLLQMPADGRNGEIRSSHFYLADSGRHHPARELAATIRAWFSAGHGTNGSAGCTYPARYTWLARFVELPGFDPAFLGCTRFRHWARLDTLRSVSVIFVSGYLGNPASSFGHSLLRFDYGPPRNRHQLLDKTFSFGALVPPHENMLAYIFRGITGGYQAGFSDHPYYDKDQVYTHRQLRDMWRYRLRLSPRQRFMVIAHLWEITAKKFRYYFLTKNCTYRMAALLGLVTHGRYTPHARLWYAPIELFYALAATPSRVADITYIPSYQRRFYARFKALPAPGKTVFRDLIRHPASGLARLADKPATPAEKSRVLSTAIAYYDYRLPGSKGADERRLKQRRHKLVLARLRRAPRHRPLAQPKPLPAPTSVHPPIRLAVGAIRDGNEAGATIAWSPHYRDALSNIYPGIKAFRVLDTRVTITPRHGVRLDKLTFIGVRQFSSAPSGIPDESDRSWAVRGGLDRGFLGHRPLDLSLSGAIGRAHFLPHNLLGYAAWFGEARALHTDLVTGPRLGLAKTRGTWRYEATLGAGYDLDRRHVRARATIQGARSLNAHNQLRATIRTDFSDARAGLSFNHYW